MFGGVLSDILEPNACSMTGEWNRITAKMVKNNNKTLFVDVFRRPTLGIAKRHGSKGFLLYSTNYVHFEITKMCEN